MTIDACQGDTQVCGHSLVGNTRGKEVTYTTNTEGAGTRARLAAFPTGPRDPACSAGSLQFTQGDPGERTAPRDRYATYATGACGARVYTISAAPCTVLAGIEAVQGFLCLGVGPL